MTTRTVGPGKDYPTVQAAYAASASGDILAVTAGTYGDPNLNITKNITIQGVGGNAIFSSANEVQNGKGYFITNANVVFDHIEFTKARGGNSNGAGIRYESGNLTCTNCYFHDNVNSILAAPNTNGTVTLKNSEFSKNGDGGGQTHNLYIGEVASLAVDLCYFHDCNGGNEFKSRAIKTTVTNTRIQGGNATANWEVDLPNGGNNNFTNCVIQQSANSANHSMMNSGAEGITPAHTVNKTTFTDCTFVNDFSGGYLWVVFSGVTVSFVNCKMWSVGATTMPSGATITKLTTRPTLDTSQPWKGGTTPAPPPPPPPPPPPTAGMFGVGWTTVLTPAVITPASVTTTPVIDVSAYGIKASEYTSRVAIVDTSAGAKITVDGIYSVTLSSITAASLKSSNFKFAA